MSGEDVMKMCERGECELICCDLLIMRPKHSKRSIYMSIDGKYWSGVGIMTGDCVSLFEEDGTAGLSE